MKNKIVIIGAGITGITIAERLSSEECSVQAIEKRSHIGGNCYDFKKEEILVHKYGPHIFHTDNEKVWNYLSQFTEWREYNHKVLCKINNNLVPLPFNINSLYKYFSREKAQKTEEQLKKTFPNRDKVPILKLRKADDKLLRELANFIYENIFLNYSQKQWGLKPEEIDKEVTARVPVVIQRDNRYFHDKYQGIPKEGYTRMFEKMLGNDNIEIELNTNYFDIKNELNYDALVYTGPLDKFFDYKYGRLDYRKLELKIETKHKENYQPTAVVNYPDLKYPFTRTTEFKKLTGQTHSNTTIAKEFPGNEGFLAWPTLDEKNEEKLEKYKKEKERVKNVYFAGRLAEYKYYDMDDAVKKALELTKKIKYEE